MEEYALYEWNSMLARIDAGFFVRDGYIPDPRDVVSMRYEELCYAHQWFINHQYEQGRERPPSPSMPTQRLRALLDPRELSIAQGTLGLDMVILGMSHVFPPAEAGRYFHLLNQPREPVLLADALDYRLPETAHDRQQLERLLECLRSASNRPAQQF